MKIHAKYGLAMALLLLAGTAFGVRAFWPHPLIPTPRSTAQTDLTRDMRPICIGRFLIDIPARYYPEPGQNSVKVRSAFDLFDKYISLDYPVTLDEYNKTVETAWQEIDGNFSNHDLSVYKKLPQKLTPRPNGYILASKFRETYGTQWVNGEIVKVDVAMANQAVGYYWENGTMFTIKSPGSSLATKDMTDVINHLSSYDWSKAPEKPGICLYQGFLEKYYAPDFEQVSMGIEFTDQFRISLITKRGEGRNPDYPTELRRTGSRLRATPEFVAEGDDRIYVNHVYRANEYQSPHFAGEEIVRSISTGFADNDPPEWENKMVGRWEVIGGPYESNRTYIYKGETYTPKINYPDILFQMSVKTETRFRPEKPGYPPVGSNGEAIPTEEEFFAVWDAMVDSIRYYPGAITSRPDQLPEVTPGPSAEQTTRNRQELDDFLGDN